MLSDALYVLDVGICALVVCTVFFLVVLSREYGFDSYQALKPISIDIISICLHNIKERQMMFLFFGMFVSNSFNLFYGITAATSSAKGFGRHRLDFSTQMKKRTF
jgi:hypothetical protein